MYIHIYLFCKGIFGFAEPEMVKTLNHVEEEETPDSSSPTERRRVDQKGNASRSKHSETEQRRRSKINERFQILRDLIPENDQKRDKASFLLEVIHYIQFLHEKLQMYEGSCQDWSPEPTKLTPWKSNSEPVESFVDQSHFERLLSGHEDNAVNSSTLLSNAHNSVELEFNGAALHKPTEKLPMAGNQGLPLNIPLQPPMFEGVPGQPHQGFFPNAEQFTQQPRSHIWRGKSCLDDCSVPIYSANEEELKTENGEDGISSAYSQGLLMSLSNALRSSGMDLSQSNISVQVDIGKRTNSGSTATMFDMKDHENPSCLHPVDPLHISERYEHPHKKLRADQS